MNRQLIPKIRRSWYHCTMSVQRIVRCLARRKPFYVDQVASNQTT